MSLITVKALEALKVTDNGKRLTDGGSMFGMVRATKDENDPVSVDFQWRFKLNGKTRQMRIGSWPKLTLKLLRTERDKLRSEVKKGIDPIERKAADKLKIEVDKVEAHHHQLDRLEEIAEKQARLTVRGLFDLWRTLSLKHRVDNGAEAQRAFERDVFPLIGDMAVADVKKAHVQHIVDSMMARDIVRMTKRVLSDLRQMFGFAMDRDFVDSDPTARIKKAKIGPDGERERVLNEAELIDLLKKLPLSGLATTSQCALLLQMATITRIGETVAARWEHVDIERKLWLLPHTKNGKAHQIWLSDFAIRQLEILRNITGATAWLFPNSKLTGPLDPKTVTKQVADRQRTNGPMSGRTKQIDALQLAGGQWRPHDLRRTGATAMAELGALPDVVEKCLNHTEESKMKRIYQRATYEGPMREAWKLWGERLDLLQNKPNNVLTVRAA
ncbi:tyrosine-type recombinase/integrase [Polaromonas sp.]|uniref:tyrosine-type recombinase/integrase n=1 Tax=Polaromonas sp. TaxID=1869339 RepID=UPI0025FE15E4|nr:tyrosine-type recombinase/integrase [Polaromonas sp.]